MGSRHSLTEAYNNLILFDGVCNLCDGAVQFIIKRDKRKVFRFASLQSEVGERILQESGARGGVYSILLVRDGKLYDRSTAALEIVRELSGPWSWLYVLRIIPKFLRDAVYRVVASSRYRVFGKKDQCMIPTPELRSRFVG